MPTSSAAQIGPSREQCGDPAMLQALATPAMYPGVPRVSVHETHASWVFVAGERAYKVKKPLALGFLDYSTLALRHSACREEVRVNQQLAPGIYLGVRAIVRDGDGYRIVPDGAPDAVEYVVEMRAFSEDDTFAGLIAAGSLTRAHVTAAARAAGSFPSLGGAWWRIGTPIGCSRCGGAMCRSWCTPALRPGGTWMWLPASARPS